MRYIWDLRPQPSNISNSDHQDICIVSGEYLKYYTPFICHRLLLARGHTQGKSSDRWKSWGLTSCFRTTNQLGCVCRTHKKSGKVVPEKRRLIRIMLYSRCVSFANLIIFHQARFPSIQWILKNKLGKVETTQLLEDVEFCQSNSSSSKRCAPSSNSSTPLSIGWATPPFFAPVLMVLWHTVFFIRNPQNSEKVPKNP